MQQLKEKLTNIIALAAKHKRATVAAFIVIAIVLFAAIGGPADLPSESSNTTPGDGSANTKLYAESQEKQGNETPSGTQSAIDESTNTSDQANRPSISLSESQTINASEIPDYSGSAVIDVNNNQPSFSESEMLTTGYENYGNLDMLGRATGAIACIGKETMPTSDREDISDVYPTGWVQNKYDFVDGGYLYNRCHLIGFQLTGENANERNLITGTRYMNTSSMLPFENKIADYVETTGRHVMYRVTPVYDGENLLAKGVLIEAKSVEDNGAGICFNKFCYNIEPGVDINYATGENWANGQTTAQELSGQTSVDSGYVSNYVLNVNSKKIHLPGCSSVSNMNPGNKQEVNDTLSNLEAQGYTKCKLCLS